MMTHICTRHSTTQPNRTLISIQHTSATLTDGHTSLGAPSDAQDAQARGRPQKKIQFSQRKWECAVNAIKILLIYVHPLPVSSYCRLARSIKDGGGGGGDEVGWNVMDTVDDDNDCDLLNCDHEPDDNDKVVVCAATGTGSIATFRSECGVKLLNCYQRRHGAATYRIITRKACAHKKVFFLRGHCDKLVCENNNEQLEEHYPEKHVCATNGDSIALFKSACHVEVLNCYQKLYRKPSKDQVQFLLFFLRPIHPPFITRAQICVCGGSWSCE